VCGSSRLTQALGALDIPPQPEGFNELCERVGLAIMLGQKVQYALAGYYATYSRVKHGTSVEEAKAEMQSHLSKTMGAVVSAIEKSAPLPEATWSKVKVFQKNRNWLVHDFDEEATPFLAQGEHFAEYTARMEAIAHSAVELMQLIDAEGRSLVTD
jgi:hypothetical protein